MCVCVCACVRVCERGSGVNVCVSEWGSGVCVYAHMCFFAQFVMSSIILALRDIFLLCVDCFQMTCPHGSNKSVNSAVPKPHLEIQSKHTSRT